MIWVASLTGKSMVVDSLVMLFCSTDFLKGAPFAMAIMLIWNIHRVYALRMFTVVILSVLAARISQSFFYSPRPIMVKEIAEHFGEIAKGFRLDWNSFPSDHMCLYFPIALMTYLKFRGLGMALIIWSIVVVGIPRIMVGRHFPSDILGGMAVGSAILFLVWAASTKIDPILEKFSTRAEKYPKTAHALVFLFCFQIATVFDGVRHTSSTLKHILMHLFVS